MTVVFTCGCLDVQAVGRPNEYIFRQPTVFKKMPVATISSNRLFFRMLDLTMRRRVFGV
jgi:hypothetical protein